MLDLSARAPAAPPARALITGASSGIGEATARRLAASGVEVILLSEQAEALERVAASVRHAGGSAHALCADLSDPSSYHDVIAAAEARFGPIDTLINNAGVGLCAPVLHTAERDLRRIFEINFFALAALSRQALELMSARGAGRIINISSVAGCFGSPGISAYSATKGAVHAFSQALRAEASSRGVWVTEILPISVSTSFFESSMGRTYQPRGRVMRPDDVARSICAAVAARRPRPEVLPFLPIRALFVINAIMPATVCRMFHWFTAAGARKAAQSPD